MRYCGLVIIFSIINIAIVVFTAFYIITRDDKNDKAASSTSENTAVRTDLPITNDSIILNDMAHDDPRLIAEIRRRFLIRPPPPNTPLFLSEPEHLDMSQGQLPFLRKFFNESRNGFYVEVGGYDGETFSNTLFFERKLGWRGVLIEAEPSFLKNLLEKQRNVWVVPTCLSITGKPTRVKFQTQEAFSRVIKSKIDHKDFQVQCLPFYSIMLALNITYIDFFSLDIEGAEFEVIKTIPWDKIKVKLLEVEYNHIPEGRQPVIDYLQEKGFKNYEMKGVPDYLQKQDVMFTRD